MGFLRNRTPYDTICRIDRSNNLARRHTKRHLFACLWLLRGKHPIYTLAHQYWNDHRACTDHRYTITFLQLWWLLSLGLYHLTLHLCKTRRRALKPPFLGAFHKKREPMHVHRLAPLLIYSLNYELEHHVAHVLNLRLFL